MHLGAVIYPCKNDDELFFFFKVCSHTWKHNNANKWVNKQWIVKSRVNLESTAPYELKWKRLRFNYSFLYFTINGSTISTIHICMEKNLWIKTDFHFFIDIFILLFIFCIYWLIKSYMDVQHFLAHSLTSCMGTKKECDIFLNKISNIFQTRSWFYDPAWNPYIRKGKQLSQKRKGTSEIMICRSLDGKKYKLVGCMYLHVLRINKLFYFLPKGLMKLIVMIELDTLSTDLIHFEQK